MNKLTIHHVAKRLPYGVIGVSKHEAFYRLSTFCSMKGHGIEDKTIDIFLDAGFIKPVLFPLSALTQEITVNGNYIKPIEYISTSKADSQQTMKRVAYGQSLDVLETWKMDRLLELHFDVDSLIPAGLAISVFDLPENPYHQK